MNQSQFKSWLQDHYPLRASINRKAFLAAFNAAARLYGGESITAAALNNWLHRKPPSKWAGMPLADFLEVVRGIEVMKVAKVYRLSLPVDAEQMAALEAMGTDSGGSVETLLQCEMLGLVEQMVEDWEKAQRKRFTNSRKQPPKA